MAANDGTGKACSAREVLEEFNKSGVRVAWPRLADLLKVPPQMVHRILKKHEPMMTVNEDESLTEVLNHWENNDPNHTWEVLSLALLSDRVYKELGASLYSKHVKPEEFTVDLVYEEIKDLTDDHQEIAYVLIEDSKQLREIWEENADKLSFEERTRLVIDHWMKNNPASSWLLLAKRLDWYIHGENEIAAQELAARIREKYIPKVEERRAYGPPEGLSEERKILKEFSAEEAFKELTAVEDWFGLGWFLKVGEEELTEIEKSHGRDDDRKLAMLKLWVETQPKTASWNNLAFAVKKMPQHQSLAQDIEEKLSEQLQAKTRDTNLRSLYNDFFARLIESLCDDQTHSSLVHQLASLSLISETDKETQLSSAAQDPRQRAVSLLVLLNIEEKPQHLIDLIRAMSNIDKMKSLVDEMTTQYKTMEGPPAQHIYPPPPPAMEGPPAQHMYPPSDMEEEMIGVHIVDEITFELEGKRARPLLWEEHRFSLFIPENALLPDETCLVTVKAIDTGLFEFPEDIEPVSAVYAISLTKPLRAPAKLEMQHCVKLGSAESSKHMSFVVASQDTSSIPYKFELVPGGVFKKDSCFGSIERQQFSFFSIGWFWRLLGYDDSMQYRASTFQCRDGFKYQWILALTKNLDTMKENLTNSLKGKDPDAEVMFEFEESELTIEIEGDVAPGWRVLPPMMPCTITKREVDTRKHNEGPLLCKVKIEFDHLERPPTESLNNAIRLVGIKPQRTFPIHVDALLLRRLSDSSSISIGEMSPLTQSLDSPLDDPPTQRDFMEYIVDEIPDKWRQFGVRLNIGLSKLDAITLSGRTPDMCFFEVYNIWKTDMKPPFTWRTAVETLAKLNKRLSKKVSKQILDQSLLTS